MSGAQHTTESPSSAKPVKAPFVSAHAQITRGHRSSFQYQSSALPTIAGYAVGMAKARARKRKSKAAADDAMARDDESTLPRKKPPAPSGKHRLKRGRRAKSDEIGTSNNDAERVKCVEEH
jgi:hypothetical protein